MNTSKSLTAAIIGAGRVGNYHTLAQTALHSNVVIFDPNIDRAKTIAVGHENVTVVETMEEAIDTADVVHICTPPMYHLDAALESIDRGKPTIIEKPLAFGLDDAVKIYQATLRNPTAPVILATSFRIGPSPTAIYELLRSGKIGALGSLETSYVHDTKNLEAGPTWRKQLKGDAFLYEGGTHAVDLNMWLANQPVTEVQASVSGKKTRPEYLWDEDFAINLKYADGTLGRVWVNASAPLPRHGSGLAVYGSTGAFRAHSKEPHYESYKEGDQSWTVHPIDVELTMKTMQSMAAVFNDYILGKRSDFNPMPGIEEGLRLMIVLNTIQKALVSGRTEQVSDMNEVVSSTRDQASLAPTGRS